MAEQVALSALERADEFVRRHIGPDDAQIQAMLEVVQARSLDDLIDQATPGAIRTKRPLELPEPVSERMALETLRRMAERNRVQVSMIGMGYYDTITPPVIQRNVLENPGWYTAYTPYQAEVSQGRLEALLDLSTDGHRPDRAGARQRLPARRGHRRGRGDGDDSKGRQEQRRCFLRRRRLPSADPRRPAHARWRPRPEDRDRRSVSGPGAGQRLRRPAPLSRLERSGARLSAGDRTAACARRRLRSWRPIC